MHCSVLDNHNCLKHGFEQSKQSITQLWTISNKCKSLLLRFRLSLRSVTNFWTVICVHITLWIVKTDIQHFLVLDSHNFPKHSFGLQKVSKTQFWMVKNVQKWEKQVYHSYSHLPGKNRFWTSKRPTLLKTMYVIDKAHRHLHLCLNYF